MQLCPAWLNPATLIFAAADFQSLSASMITGALLPSSNPTFLRGALARMSQPTGGEPVNVINAMPGWSTIALPTVEPPPTTTCSHSPGRPHSSINIEASASELSGVCDAGFSTTGQPAAIAGATLWTTRLSGKLNGAIAPITPIGTRRVKPSLPSPACRASRATTSPVSVRASAAANRNVPTARCASCRAVLIGLAASAAMIRANSSNRSVSRTAARSRISARCHGGSGRSRSTAAAAATARSTSAAEDVATSPTVVPSYGERTVKVEPEAGCAGAVMPATILAAVPTAAHPYLDWPGPLPFAHRGGASDAPENTLPAFQDALDLGYRYLETDVRCTADGVVVAFHDDNLMRTCNRPGKISELPWSEVRTAMVDGKAPIPSLEELLGALPGARVNIDCKADNA